MQLKRLSGHIWHPQATARMCLLDSGSRVHACHRRSAGESTSFREDDLAAELGDFSLRLRQAKCCERPTSDNRAHRQHSSSGPSNDHRSSGCIHLRALPRAMATDFDISRLVLAEAAMSVMPPGPGHPVAESIYHGVSIEEIARIAGAHLYSDDRGGVPPGTAPSDHDRRRDHG